MPRFILRILVALLTFGAGLAATMLWNFLRPVEARPPAAELYYQQAERRFTEAHACEAHRYNRLEIERGNDAVSSHSRILNAGVLDHRAIEKPAPRYPPIVRSAQVSGTVVVQVTVDETGRVESAYAVTGHPLLQSSAVEAARQARLSPTRLNGSPVKIYGVLTYRFSAQ